MSFDRRQFLQGLAAAGVLAGLPLRASPGVARNVTLSGTEFDLVIGESPANFTGRTRTAITVNGIIPAPLLRW